MGLAGKTVIIGGSLRRKEYRILIRAFLELRKSHRKIALVLAPRHLTDLPKYKDFLESEGIPYSKISDPEKQQALTDIHIVDTMGMLMKVYALGDLTFIGGTLEPLGGHNPLEPALMGNVVIHGSSTHNNFPAFSLLSKCKVSFEVNAENLIDKMAMLLKEKKKLALLGKKATTCVKSLKAVTQIIYDKIF
jgi:3-deoxy-D-manno-octulosonic-acid transferase